MLVFNTGNISWSSCGAERSQPSAAHGKRSRPETAQSKPKPSRSASLRRMNTSMVRRGSTVRVRQRALQKRRTSALSRSGRLAPCRTCGGYGAVYGAFALAATSTQGSGATLAFPMPDGVTNLVLGVVEVSGGETLLQSPFSELCLREERKAEGLVLSGRAA